MTITALGQEWPVETWHCCRDWPIVPGWPLRVCGECGEYPARRPELDVHEPVTCAVDPCDEPATWHELCRVHAAEDHEDWRWTERD